MTAAHEATRQAARDLAEALTYFADAEQRLHDSNPAFPGASSYDGPGGRSANTDTHPERHALNPDPTQFDRDAFAKVTRSLSRDALLLRNLVEAWKGNKTPTARQRAEVDHANDLEPECLHCREHIGRHEPYRTITDVDGILPDPVPLCRWHTDFTARTERPATKHETDLHHQGRTIRLPA